MQGVLSPAAGFVAGLPKAELHMHVEGSIEPELFIELARRNRVSIPWSSVEALRDAYRFENLQGFLDLYYDGCRVLVNPEDFHAVTAAYLRRAREDRVLHAELFLGPQGHTLRGVPLAVALEGVFAAFDEARREGGPSAGLLLVAQRHRSEAEALAMLDDAMPWADRLLGFGLGGAEVGNPPQKFVEYFRRARERGFRVVAHAGEEGPAQYVRDTVDLLQVDRIDHGNACMDDPGLVSLLARRAVPLTVCPVSNLKLNVVGSLDAHPLRRMLEAGLHVTVNSDDPSYFGGYINDNFVRCQQALGLTRADVVRLARNSFEASFQAPSEKVRCLAELDAYDATATAWRDGR